MASGPLALMEALKTIIDAEFAPEGITARYDNLHGSLGSDGPICGLSPEMEEPVRGDNNQLTFSVMVQFFLRYTLEIDPHQTVDPSAILAMATRFREACHAWEIANPGVEELWFLTVGRIAYPDDPTGNKSRFVARVIGRGGNPSELG